VAQSLHAFDFLNAQAKHPAKAVCVAFGDDPFLRRLVVEAIIEQVLGSDDAEFGLAKFDGGSGEWRAVHDELSTMAMFGGSRRLVIVDDADDFVSRFRTQLEDYVAKPRNTGVLLLCPKTWASNTRLFKAVDSSGLQVECKSPTEGRIAKFLADRAKKVHGATLPTSAAEMLVEMIGPELGLLERAGRRPNLREALEQAGFKSFTLNKAEGQLKKIGRRRAAALYQVLLDADLALKGQSSAPAKARLALERLLTSDVAGVAG
jgi:DNA polymerase-3 subunit delta